MEGRGGEQRGMKDEKEPNKNKMMNGKKIRGRERYYEVYKEE